MSMVLDYVDTLLIDNGPLDTIMLADMIFDKYRHCPKPATLGQMMRRSGRYVILKKKRIATNNPGSGSYLVNIWELKKT